MNKRAVAVYKIKVLLLTALLLVTTDVSPQESKKVSHGNMLARMAPAASVFAPAARLSETGLIAFSAGGQIYVMNSDGSGVSPVTDRVPEVRNLYPALSPDGSRIAFIRDEGVGNYALCVIGVDGKNLQRITGGDIPLGEPAWSPDGSRLAYVRGYDPTSEGFAGLTSCSPDIYVIDVASRKEVNVTQGAGGTDPSWSPDGTRIAFSSNRDGNYEIYTAALNGSQSFNGSQIQRLTYTEWAEAEPSWSPDGGRIAYVAHLIQANSECGFMPTGGAINLASSSVYLMNADGSNQTSLAGTTGTTELSWSPSGAWLALALRVRGDAQIYVIDAWGGNLTKLTSDPTPKYSPSWARYQTTSK
ncbi:MAG TPA: hypothetical protein VN256_27050 [Pyrinomonadaceae bacterium]|nr:hypothetical protein [Pyrinomonadaceae bacterium]